MIWGLTDHRLRSISGAELEGTSPVRLIYCDESGLAAERFIVVAGVIIEADKQYMPVANYLRSLIEEFIEPKDRRNFSFHATDIFSGGKIYKDKEKYPLQKRIQLLSRLLEIPAIFCDCGDLFARRRFTQKSAELSMHFARALPIHFVAATRDGPHTALVPKRDPNQQAARAVQKIAGSEPVRGEDLVSSEELKRKFREAKRANRNRAQKRP